VYAVAVWGLVGCTEEEGFTDLQQELANLPKITFRSVLTYTKEKRLDIAGASFKTYYSCQVWPVLEALVATPRFET
jgi:hypothetical protein